MNLSSTLVALLFILILCGGIILYIIYFRRKKEAIIPRYRMLVAIRRRQAGISRFIELNYSDQEHHLNILDSEWVKLNTRFSQVGDYAGGFISSKSGLPSGSEDEWTTFGLYDLPDYDAYQVCRESLDENQFQNLRNHIDIRLIFGRNLMDLQGVVRQLF